MPAGLELRVEVVDLQLYQAVLFGVYALERVKALSIRNRPIEGSLEIVFHSLEKNSDPLLYAIGEPFKAGVAVRLAFRSQRIKPAIDLLEALIHLLEALIDPIEALIHLLEALIDPIEALIHLLEALLHALGQPLQLFRQSRDGHTLARHLTIVSANRMPIAACCE